MPQLNKAQLIEIVLCVLYNFSFSCLLGDNFKCPKFMGTFPHPTDCSKYYNCMIYVPSLKACPEKQLFDTEKSSCKPEKEVNCGNRKRPGK